MLQECVAVNRVNECIELGYEFDLVPARLYFEVGNLGAACNVDVLQNSAVVSSGSQDAGDAAIDTEIRTIKCVLAGNWSIARMALGPDAELPPGCDFAW